MDIAADKIIGKLKSVCVLYDFVAVGHNSERFIIGAAHIGFVAGDFADEFAMALSKVDKLILLDIYPAREEPIPGVSSEIIFRNVTAPEKVLLRKEELMDYLKDEPLEALVTLGAGNIDRFIQPITQMLEERQTK